MGENVEQGRNADILQSIVDDVPYTDPPQSRIEDLLLQVKEVIEEGGGGGGDVTSVNGKTGAVTLTASDVGAYTTAETDALLGDKQSKTMSASVKIGAETETTVEGAIGEVAAIIPATAAVSNKLSTAADTAKEDITATANSDNIALTDSADARVHDLKIYGKTVDGHSVGENGLTVSTGGGKNRLPITDLTNTYNRVTVAGNFKNGTVTLSGTSSFDYQDVPFLETRYSQLLPVDENTRYVLIGGYSQDIYIIAYPYAADGTTYLKGSYNSISNSNPNIFTPKSGTKYLRLRIGIRAGGTVLDGITIKPMLCTETEYNTNSEIEPYVSSSMTLSTTLPLRGSYKTVDLGSLNWYYETEWVQGPQVTLPRFAVALGTLSDAYIPNEAFGVAMSSCSSRYTPMLDPYPEAADKMLYIGKNKGMYIIDHDYTDPAEFKAAVTGITLTYPSYCDEIDLADGVAITRLDSNGDVLATPVTTPLSDAEKAAFAEFRTFDGNTNVTATDDPFMSLNYVKNTDNGKALADVDNKSAVRMAMIAAPYDDTATYAVGNYCTYGDRLWKCNTAIGTAEPFTAAHWTATTVMEEI